MKCDKQAPRILEYERRKQEAARLEEENWQKCTTPGERACANIDRFMEHYFLADGRPDHTKTTEPLALYGYTDRSDIQRRAERIGGLETHWGGEGSDRTMCIGWNRSAVWQLAGTIDNKSWEKKAKEQEDQWEEAMDEHRDFIASMEKKNGKKVALTNREKLDKCKGSYIVRCEDLSGGWDNCNSLGIDIAAGPKAGILQAAVKFGILKGTMLLSFNESELDEYVGTSGKYGNSDSDDDEDDEDSEGSYLSTATSSKKRKAPTKNAVTTKPGRGRPKKQAKGSAPTSNRLHFRLRGRETGEGMIFFNPEKGYLDFTDSNYVAFKGVASLPAVGNKVPFEGFKVSAEAITRAQPWSTFSEKVHEEERTSRWH